MAGRAYTGSQGSELDLSVDGIVAQMRQRPLLTLGLGLIAGSLLQDFLGGGTSGSSYGQSSRAHYPDYIEYGTEYGQPAYGDTNTVRQGVNNAARTVGDVAQSAGDMVSDAASGVVDTARDAASTVADAASSVVDTTVDVAQRVADTTVDVAYQGMEAYERAGDLASTISNFVSGNPLMALGLSLAAGSLLQRYLRGGSTSSRPSYQSYAPSYPTYQPSYTSYQDRDYTRPATTSSYQDRDYTRPATTSSYGTSGVSSGISTTPSYGTSGVSSGTTTTSSYGDSGLSSGSITTGEQPANAVGGVVITSTPSTGQEMSSTSSEDIDSTRYDSLNASQSHSDTNDQ
jgi:hypothetical protein